MAFVDIGVVTVQALLQLDEASHGEHIPPSSTPLPQDLSELTLELRALSNGDRYIKRLQVLGQVSFSAMYLNCSCHCKK